MAACEYGDVLIIELPISRALIRDAVSPEAVARMAEELAGQSAYEAVIKRHNEYNADTEED